MFLTGTPGSNSAGAATTDVPAAAAAARFLLDFDDVWILCGLLPVVFRVYVHSLGCLSTL